MATPSEKPTHLVFTDEGEYFDEDPSFGRGVPCDPVGAVGWAPLTPAACTPEVLAAIKKSLVTVEGASTTTP